MVEVDVKFVFFCSLLWLKMYHGKKKFTFDDPEDSYWNESGNGSTASSLFDDLPSKQVRK